MEEHRFPISDEVANRIDAEGIAANTYQTAHDLSTFLHKRWHACTALPGTFLDFAYRLVPNSLVFDEDAGWSVSLLDGQNRFALPIPLVELQEALELADEFSLNKETAFVEFLSAFGGILPGFRSNDIAFIEDEWSGFDEDEGTYIAFLDVGNGDIFSISNDDGAIFFFDHETNELDEIHSTFNDFILRMFALREK